MLNAGMSARAVAAQCNVHFSTISRLRRRFRLFGTTTHRPHPRRPCATTPAQDRYIRLLHLRYLLRPATLMAQEPVGVNDRRVSAQTIRNRLRENGLRARRPYQGLDLTDVRRRNRLEWANVGPWCAGDRSSSLTSPGSSSSGPTVGSVCGVVLVSVLLTLTCPTSGP